MMMLSKRMIMNKMRWSNRKESVNIKNNSLHQNPWILLKRKRIKHNNHQMLFRIFKTNLNKPSRISFFSSSTLLRSKSLKHMLRAGSFSWVTRSHHNWKSWCKILLQLSLMRRTVTTLSKMISVSFWRLIIRLFSDYSAMISQINNYRQKH